MKKDGLELIREERESQKANYTILRDAITHSKGELSRVAQILLWYPKKEYSTKDVHEMFPNPPEGWNTDQFHKMQDKTYKERLVISAALIAAELDRLNILEEHEIYIENNLPENSNS